MLSYDEFLALKKQGFTHVPLITKRLMDERTPLSVFANVRHLNGTAYLFESVEGHEKWARFSVIGLGSSLLLQYSDGLMTSKVHNSVSVDKIDDPIVYLRELMSQYHLPETSDLPQRPDLPELPAFSGGLVGYFSNNLKEVVQFTASNSECAGDEVTNDTITISDITNTNKVTGYASPNVHLNHPAVDKQTAEASNSQDASNAQNASQTPSNDQELEKQSVLSLPDMWLILSQQVIVFDKLNHTLSIIVYADCDDDEGYANAIKKIEKIQESLADVTPMAVDILPTPKFRSVSNQDNEQHHEVDAQSSLCDQNQPELAAVLSASYMGDGLNVYRAVRYLQPSSHLFLVHGYTLDNHKRFDIIGASPCCISRVENQQITLRILSDAIKRQPQVMDGNEDMLAKQQQALREHQLVAPQHQYAHSQYYQCMLPLCKENTLKTTDKAYIECSSQSLQLGLNIKGKLQQQYDALDVLVHSLQAQSKCNTQVTQAPTVTSTATHQGEQKATHKEDKPTLVFDGFVGYLGWHGNMDTVNTRHNAIIRKGEVYVQNHMAYFTKSPCMKREVSVATPTPTLANTQTNDTDNNDDSQALVAPLFVDAVKMAANGLHIK